MAGFALAGDTSGQLVVNAPAVAGTNTLTLQAATATNAVNTLATAVATTSGTSIDYTGLPAWVKKITVSFQGVSTNSTSLWLLQLGTSGGVTTSGYLGRARDLASTTSAYSAGFTLLTDSSAGAILHGLIHVVTLGSNNFAMSGILSRSDGANIYISGGSIALGGVLDRVRLTTVNGTDVFDAGSVNILYEG
jgi:hypothetical protein